MIIKTDAEGQKQLAQLFDVALKAGGLQNYQQITMLMNSVRIFTPEEIAQMKAEEAVKMEALKNNGAPEQQKAQMEVAKKPAAKKKTTK